MCIRDRYRSLIAITEKHLQYQHNLFHNFRDFKKAFDRVYHASIPNRQEGLVQAF